MRAAGAWRCWPIWIAAAPVALWTALRLLGVDGGFPLAPLMAFTPYAAIAALLVAGVAVAARNWAASLVAGLATIALLGAVLPRAIETETVSAAGRGTLTVLAANVHDGDGDPAALVALVDRLHPDLLSVEELTPAFARELASAGIASRLPEAILEPHRGASGTGLYSRLPMRRLPSPVHFLFRIPRAELALPGGRRVRVVGVHPFPPQSGNVGVWEAALRSLPSAGAGVPWVLAGDFNATFDQSQFRDLVGRGYRDAGAAAGKGLEPTFPREGHLIPPVTIDHVLADRRLGVVSYSVEELPGSDHRAVHAVLALP